MRKPPAFEKMFDGKKVLIIVVLGHVGSNPIVGV